MTQRREPEIVEPFASEDGGSLAAAETLALAVDAIVPSPSLRARLALSLEHTHRFDDLEDAVARLADVSVDRARALLLEVDAPSATWDRGPAPGIDLMHFEGGPRVKNAVTGFVRHAPGITFPEHDHVGEENVLVLQGAFEDSDGVVYRSGEIAARAASSSHSYRAIGPLPLLTMAIVQGGVILDGIAVPPGDPRA